MFIRASYLKLLEPSLLGTYVQNIVSSNESISKFVFQLAIYIFFGLFQCNIHVSI